MNKVRRKRLGGILKRLRDTREDLGSLLEEEDEARENIPENLQSSDSYEDSENASDAMDSACESIGEAITTLEEVF